MKVLDYNGLDHVIDKIYDTINSGGGADYIVEENTSGMWTYRKWASGVAECWGRTNMTVTNWSQWGNLYEGSPYPSFTFPSGLFIDIPCVTASVALYGVSGGVISCEMGVVSQSGIGYIIPLRPIVPSTTNTNFPYNYFVQAKGRWREFAPGVSKYVPIPEVHTNTVQMGLRKIGKIVELRFFGKKSSEVRSFTMPEGYRPSETISFPITVVYNNKLYQGYMTVSKDGACLTYYYNYGQGDNVPEGNSAIYSTIIYFAK